MLYDVVIVALFLGSSQALPAAQAAREEINLVPTVGTLDTAKCAPCAILKNNLDPATHEEEDTPDPGSGAPNPTITGKSQEYMNEPFKQLQNFTAGIGVRCTPDTQTSDDLEEGSGDVSCTKFEGGQFNGHPVYGNDYGLYYYYIDYRGGNWIISHQIFQPVGPNTNNYRLEDWDFEPDYCERYEPGCKSSLLARAKNNPNGPCPDSPSGWMRLGDEEERKKGIFWQEIKGSFTCLNPEPHLEMP